MLKISFFRSPKFFRGPENSDEGFSPFWDEIKPLDETRFLSVASVGSVGSSISYSPPFEISFEYDSVTWDCDRGVSDANTLIVEHGCGAPFGCHLRY